MVCLYECACFYIGIKGIKSDFRHWNVVHCLQFNLSVQKEIETIWIEKCSFFWLFKGVSLAYWYFIYSFGVWSLIVSYELRHNESVYILTVYWALKFYDNYGISGFIVPVSVWCWPKKVQSVPERFKVCSYNEATT